MMNIRYRASSEGHFMIGLYTSASERYELACDRVTIASSESHVQVAASMNSDDLE